MTLLQDKLDDDLRQRFGISLTEYEIMVRLSETPDHSLRMAHLADSLAHSRSRVTHTVKRLEEGGLVLRAASPEDGRGIVCRLTERVTTSSSRWRRPTCGACARTSSTWRTPTTSRRSAG